MSDNIDIVQVLVQRLRVEEDDSVRANIISALGEIGDVAALDVLLEILNTETGFLKQYATFAIGHIRSERSVDELLNLLDSEDWVVVADAIASLGRYVVLGKCDDRILPKFVELLGRDSVQIRMTVVSVLGHLGDKATDHIVAALEDPSYDVQTMAVKALGYNGNKQASIALAYVLNTGDERHRALAAKALCRIKLQDKEE